MADSFKSMMGKTSLEKFQEIREVGGKVLEIAATFIPYGKTVLAVLKLIKSDKVSLDFKLITIFCNLPGYFFPILPLRI